MVLKLKDKNKTLMEYRLTPRGSILKKGKKELYFLYKPSINNSNKVKKIIANNSFNKLFKKGKTLKILGNNVRYINIK